MDTCRDNLLIAGIGNTLRGDDRVGIFLMKKLEKHFLNTIKYLEIHAPDILMAETFSQFENLLIIDAICMDDDKPYKLIPIKPAKNIAPSPGFPAHVVGWDTILYTAREFFGHAPQTVLLGVAACDFDFSETLSTQCRANADKAFEFIVKNLIKTLIKDKTTNHTNDTNKVN
ncbi:hydrogenase maturation protease [Desulfobacterales bacterium HSG17]|nr:hydrogenase maturation protease [Desulfobacterales bacterium HSG17]